MKNILKNRIVGIAGAKHSGKTTTLIHFINYVQKFSTPKVAYFFHEDYKQTVQGIDKFINSIDELLDVRDSFIFIDEFKTLFNSDDRHQKETIERVFSMLEHNNNIIVLCGLPSYYNQYISKMVNCWVLKQIKFSECVNGSDLKKYAIGIRGELNGGVGLNIPVSKAFTPYGLIDIDYQQASDKKSNRVDLFKTFLVEQGKHTTHAKKSSNLAREVPV